MAEVRRTVHVQVRTFDPAQGQMVPVPRARLLIEDSGWLWDPNLSTGNDTTDNQGAAAVELTFDDAAENTLNPFATIELAEADRKVPAGVPADRQLSLPDEWVTRHYVNHRIPRITSHTNPNTPLELFVGVDARLRLAYTDFTTTTVGATRSAIRNPLPLPAHTVRVHLVDKDIFLNPDDPLAGFGFDPAQNKVIPVGADRRFPYFDAWPTAPWALDGLPATPRAWLDPPYAPVGTLGGGSFARVGALATDLHGFVFLIDGNLIRRFYPDGTLCQTIGATEAMRDPTGLALDQYRHLFVADSGNDRVLVYRLDWQDGGSGVYTHYTPASPLTAGFSNPRGLAVVPHPAVDGEELLAVVDAGHQRVQVFRVNFAGASTVAHRARGLLPVRLPAHSTFGTGGAGAGQFQDPVAVAADRLRRLFVADAGAHRISRWALDPAGAAFVHEVDWEKAGGGSGNGAREFDTPVGIAVDRDRGYVYVAETGNRRVQRLDAETGAHLVHWTHNHAPPLPQPYTPGAIAVDPRGEAYAADTANHRVLRGTVFDAGGAALADGVAPTPVGPVWTPQGDDAHMRAPGYVSFAPDGKLWVADSDNDRVLVFERDATGALALVPPAGRPAAAMSKPVGIAVDGVGNAFVVDSGNHQVLPFDAALAAQPALGGHGAAASQFDDPRGIALADRGGPVLYVADRLNNRVQRLTPAGNFTARLTTAGGLALKEPEDVAVDSLGNLYVADTGNARILQFDASDAFVRAITIAAAGQTFQTPCGISIDDEDKLIVTDRGRQKVYRVEPDGTLLAFWDLDNLLRKSVSPNIEYYTELSRLIVFDRPSRAVVDRRGLLAVADTGLDRVRLVRTRTEIVVNLLDLGERLPDISFQAHATADWNAELGLKHEVTDIGWFFDDTNELVTEPEDDFARDHYALSRFLDVTGDMNAAANVMKTVRLAQGWLQHLTREDEAAQRWGRPNAGLTFRVDISDEKGSNHPWGRNHVNLRRDTTGRGFDAWDDSVVVHEMAHWIFDKSVRPFPPYRKVGGAHQLPQITRQNTAITEGFAQYVEQFWGGEFGSTDRVRGFRLGGTGTTVSWIATDPNVAATRVWAVGGPLAAPPSFNTPEKGLEVEGYFSQAVWQIHHAIAEPGILFADQPNFWYGHNSFLSTAESARFSAIIRRALREFPTDPTGAQWDQGSRMYLLQVLARAQAEGGDWAEIVRSLLELNNQLMPEITITEGASDTAPGTPLSATVTVRTGQTRDLIVQLKDATGARLRGYNVKLAAGSSANFALRAGPGPALRHGRTAPTPLPPTELYRATNANGIVNVVFTAPAIPGGAAGTAETLTVSYQPDFDTDASFVPPARGDDRATTLRRLYLRELRSAAKAWSGVGNNFGAVVSRAVTFNVVP